MLPNYTASDRELLRLVGKHISIPNAKIVQDKSLWKKVIQPSSLDLHLAKKAWEIEGSMKPTYNEPVEYMAHEHAVKELTLDENGTEFRRDRTYIVMLQEAVPDLPAGAQIRSNPKSSTGRLDCLVRLLADRNQQYEFLHVLLYQE